MSELYVAIKAAIHTAVDAGTDTLLKLSVGTPGTYHSYNPSGVTKPAAPARRPAGALWTNDNVITTILQHVASLLDQQGVARCYVSTGATLVAPTIQDHLHVLSVTKDEVLDTITVTFTPGFQSAYYVPDAGAVGTAAVLQVTAMSAAAVTFQLRNSLTGVPISVNNLDVFFKAVGSR